MAEETGKRVSVIRSGPAGLAAASLLRRYGHAVTVYEELQTPGGTASFASLPTIICPKDVLLYETERIKGLGVEIKTGLKVGRDITLTQLLSDGSDAILIDDRSKRHNDVGHPGN